MDAQFVDVIHSNGENLILGGLGAWQPMGHVDFYPNGGRMQKGCTNLFVGAVSDMIWCKDTKLNFQIYGKINKIGSHLWMNRDREFQYQIF